MSWLVDNNGPRSLASLMRRRRLRWLVSLMNPQFRDKEFDVCFSNSVIEHVGTWDDQQSMAREVRRVAKQHFVQTPSRWFPIEPHFLLPGWQFLPISLRAFLLTKSKIGWMDRQPAYESALAEVKQIRLLTGSEIQKPFPEFAIKRGFFFGLTKSFIALGRTP